MKYERGGTGYSGTQGETRNTVLREYQHIPCTGTKGLAREVNNLYGNGGSTAYKGIDDSLSLDMELERERKRKRNMGK